MFTVELYTNESPTNKVDKDITGVISASGYLRSGSSVIDPVLVIEGPQNGTVPSSVNYMRIQAFGRYYYITNIIAVDGVRVDENGAAQLWEIHGHVDVLMSYAEQIKEQTAIVAKQAETYNLLLDDGSFMTYQNPKIQTKVFSNATPFETQTFVLTVAGN